MLVGIAVIEGYDHAGIASKRMECGVTLIAFLDRPMKGFGFRRLMAYSVEDRSPQHDGVTSSLYSGSAWRNITGKACGFVCFTV